MFSRCLCRVGTVAFLITLSAAAIAEEERMGEQEAAVERERFQVHLAGGTWQGEAAPGPVRVVQMREALEDEAPPLEGLAPRTLLAGLPVDGVEIFGHGLLTAGAAPSEEPTEAWFHDGVLIRVWGERSVGESRLLEAVVSFEDVQGGTVSTERVPLEQGSEQGPGIAVVFQRHNTPRAVAVLVTPAPQDRSAVPPYASALKTDLFTIFSRQGSWTEPAPGEPLTLRQAVVMIPERSEHKYRLQAEELAYSKASGELVARNATLFDASDEPLLQGARIRVTFEGGVVEYEPIE